MAIKSFRSAPLKAFFEDGTTRRLAVQNTARLARILAALDAAVKPSDMNLPGYRFHTLAPGQPGRYAVTATANFRVTFAWNAGAVDVDLEDYH